MTENDPKSASVAPCSVTITCHRANSGVVCDQCEQRRLATHSTTDLHTRLAEAEAQLSDARDELCDRATACDAAEKRAAEAERHANTLGAWAEEKIVECDVATARAERLAEVLGQVPGWVLEIHLSSTPAYPRSRFHLALAERIKSAMGEGSEDEPRCAECDDRGDVPFPRRCLLVGPTAGKPCTQNDGPAPEWCPRRQS